MSQPAPRSTLKLRLSAPAERAVRHGHPWVYADRIRERNRSGSAGEFAVIYDRKDRFLAIGLYDPDSPIAVRILHTGSPTPLNDAWWTERFQSPLSARTQLFDPDETSGYRCINGESDGWPGLVLDRYADVFSLKLYTAAWLPHLNRVVELVRSGTNARSLVLRLSRNIQAAARAHSLVDGQLVLGEPKAAPVEFCENGLRFEADVLKGQKTGFFLDQRENRQRVRELARGRTVLNVFSHAGGFSVYAAAGGAASTVDLDISAHALASASRNMNLNRRIAEVTNCSHSTVKANAFDWLSGGSEAAFDLIIIDPPSLAKKEGEKPGALKSYHQLAANGIRRLHGGGILVCASCSAHVPAEEFFATVRAATRQAGSGIREMCTTGHAPDHPATFPEARYLKCIYLHKS